MQKQLLIAYFSRAGQNDVYGTIQTLTIGHTELVAKKIQAASGGRLWRIERADPYPDDYAACSRQAEQELRTDARPKLRTVPPDLACYDTLLLGFPNWCGTMPMPVWTFLTASNLTGIRIYPFCTHAGGGLGRSESDLKRLCPQAYIKSSLAIFGSSAAEAGEAIAAWLAQVRSDAAQSKAIERS